MGKKKKHPLIGKTCFNQKNEKCKVIGMGKRKSKGLLILSVLSKESKVEEDGHFHYAAKLEDLSFARSPEEISEGIKKDLKQWYKQAKKYCQQIEFQLQSLRKCKEAIKPRLGNYRLNPRRFGRLVPEQISKKFRKEARDIEKQINTQFANLKIGRVAARNTTTDVFSMVENTIRNLTALQTALEGLPKQVEDVENNVKLYNYERRREIALFNKTLGKDLALSQKPITDRGQKGAKKMAGKKSDKEKVQSLLRKLAKATEQQEKREIRSELRSLGHKGGLGKGAGRPKKTKKVTKKKKKKKAKKKSAA